MANKVRLERRWREVNETLAELANLHTWPADKDIAEAEGELLEELDEIEYEVGQNLQRQKGGRP